jgi:hypothetical protein
MMWTRLETTLIVSAVLLVIVALYLRGLAARLDRLHLRVDASAAALEARLERRAALSTELALSGVLDPASSILLLNAATTAQHAGDQQLRAHSDLSAALRAVFPDAETVDEVIAEAADSDTQALLIELGEVCQSVALSRRFANEAVRAAISVRRRGIVRALRLAGHARWPETVDLDDAPPEALTGLLLNSA